MKRLIIVLCLVLVAMSIYSVPPTPRVVGQAWYHNQTSDVQPYILFTTDHAGFFRFTSMMRLYDPEGPGAYVAAAISVFSGLLNSTTDADPMCNLFATYLEDNTAVSMWANASDYDLFSSYDLFVIVEEFKE